MFNIFNFAVYQLAWFACVFGAAYDRSAIAVAAALAAIVLHLLLVRRQRLDLKPEFGIIAAAGLAGFVVDTALVQSGTIEFGPAPGLPGGQPWWMLSLWLAFATTLRHSMVWAMRNAALAAALGAVGGPLAYWAGAKFGALSFEFTATTLAMLAGCWAIALGALSLAVRQSALPTPGATLERAGPVNRSSALLLMATAAIGSVASTADAASREWHFDAFLGDKRIGYHRFTLHERGEGRELVSEASFDVRFLFFNAYRYRHVAREQWDGECLSQVRATTDDNGEKLTVQGGSEASSFVVTTDEEQKALADGSCVQTFAYWNPRILEASRLLNPQTGDYRRVRVESLGQDRIGERPAQRYRLVTVDEVAQSMRIDLWYSPGGDWLALESQLPQGQTLRYRRREDPQPPESAAQMGERTE